MEVLLNQATYHFPKGFYWGTATASHQVEGNNTNNNWWAWENEPGRIKQGHKSGLACDWWGGRWREDFDRAAECGQNAHRLSIEWSRIQPTPDRWDQDALEFYRRMLRGLRDRGMTPMVTLHHFSDPLWLTERGGWEGDKIVEYFSAFVEKAVDALKEYVNLWCTINEPFAYAAFGYILGNFPPGKQNLQIGLRVAMNQVRAHAAAYRVIHRLQPEAKVGIAIHYRGFQPANAWSPLDRLATGVQSAFINDAIPYALVDGIFRVPLWRQRIPEARGTQDYIGLNFYSVDNVAFDLRESGTLFGKRFYPPGADLSDTGFIANVPEGFYKALEWANRFKLPIIVTENGIEDMDDHIRPRYIAQHIHQMWRAVNFNWPIRGYFHWSLVDNFEWERGWTQRFGLWELNVETQIRRKRPSADLYAAVCHENGISSEMVAKYAPEVLGKIFP